MFDSYDDVETYNSYIDNGEYNNAFAFRYFTIDRHLVIPKDGSSLSSNRLDYLLMSIVGELLESPSDITIISLENREYIVVGHVVNQIIDCDDVKGLLTDETSTDNCERDKDHHSLSLSRVAIEVVILLSDFET